MNILFYQYLYIIGGGITHVYEVSKNLSKMGHNIIFLDEASPDWEWMPDIIKELKSKHSTPSWLRLISKSLLLASFLRYAYKFLQGFLLLLRYKRKIDIIYIRTTGYGFENLLAKLFKIPLVREINGLIIDEYRCAKHGSKISLFILDRLDKLILPKAEKFIVVTEKLKKTLQSDYRVPESKIVVIQNGANTELFKPIPTGEAKEKLKLSYGHNYVCFTGTLSRNQGVEYLIKSASLIVQELPNTKFLIVGDGQLREELVGLAREIGVLNCFIFTGMSPYKQVPLYINASDVCAVPKRPLRSGSSPLKLCEYMACGKPVVASRLSGVEILEQNDAGILVEPENPKELAMAITRLLKNQELRHQMGKRGREYVVKNRSWESVAGRVAKVCESVIPSTRSKRER